MKQRITLYSIDDLETVEDYEEIVCIRTNSYYKSKRFGELIGKCINLEELYFLESYFKVTIPMSILKLPKLQTLVFRGVEAHAILPFIGKLKSLKTLGLQEHFLPTFPKSLIDLPNLEELDFNNTQFGEDTNSWALLSSMKSLKYINLLRAKLEHFPIEIAEQDSLSELAVPKKFYNQLVKHSPDFCANIPYLYSHSTLEKKYYYNLLNICRKHQFDWSFRVVLFNLLAGNMDKLDRFATKEMILRTSDVKLLEIIRLKALEYYHNRWGIKTKHPLTKEAELAVVGKLGINKQELRKKLKEQGIKYSSKITPKTSHLLLGQLPNGAYNDALEQQIPILSEQYVLEFINDNSEQYLVDDADVNTAHIGQLLLSGQDENVLLALTLFKQGGFPKELLTELFLAHRQTDNTEIHRESERLIRQYGSINLVDELKKNQAIFSRYASEAGIKRKLRSLQKRTELDCIKIARHGYQAYKKGFTFLLSELPQTEGIQLLRERAEGKKLSLSQIGLTTIPITLFELKELEELDLSYNYQLRSISTKLLPKLSQLKVLTLKGNYTLLENNKMLDKIRELMPNLKLQL
jgi:Leucine-rich repeat (LRR) protein